MLHAYKMPVSGACPNLWNGIHLVKFPADTAPPSAYVPAIMIRAKMFRVIGSIRSGFSIYLVTRPALISSSVCAPGTFGALRSKIRRAAAAVARRTSRSWAPAATWSDSARSKRPPSPPLAPSSRWLHIDWTLTNYPRCFCAPGNWRGTAIGGSLALCAISNGF